MCRVCYPTALAVYLFTDKKLLKRLGLSGVVNTRLKQGVRRSQSALNTYTACVAPGVSYGWSRVMYVHQFAKDVRAISGVYSVAIQMTPSLSMAPAE